MQLGHAQILGVRGQENGGPWLVIWLNASTSLWPASMLNMGVRRKEKENIFYSTRKMPSCISE